MFQTPIQKSSLPRPSELSTVIKKRWYELAAEGSSGHMTLKEISLILCLTTSPLYEADEQEEKVGAPSREGECLQLTLC